MFFYEDENGNTIPVGPLKGASSGDVYRVCIPLMVLTTLSIALRVYVRGYMTRNFGIEDWLIIPAYILFMAICICAIVVGHWTESTDIVEHFPRVIKLLAGDTVLYIADHIFIKLSVAAFFYRICERWQRYVVVATVTIFSAYNFAFVFISLFQCGVPTIRNLLSPNIDGHCLDWSSIVRPLLIVGVALNAVCDWVFVLACLPVLAKLRRMPTGEMICVCFLIFLATGASVISLVRLGYLPGTGSGSEVLLLSQDMTFAVLSFTEAGTAIVTVCMATLHPLFLACVRRTGTSRYSANRSPRYPVSSEPIPSEKRTNPSSTAETTTEHSSLGRIGILPTIYDTEMGTMAKRDSPGLGYTTDWT